MAQGKFSRPRGSGEDQPTQMLPKLPQQEPILPVSLDLPEDMPVYDPLVEEPVPPPPLPPQEEPLPEDDGYFDEEFYEEEETVPSFFQQYGKVLLVSVCVFLLIGIGCIIGFVMFSSASDPYDNLILNNVTVAGVNIGGLSRTEAERLVEATFSDRYGNTDMVVTLPQETLRLTPEKTGARLDVAAAVNEAFQYGRTGTEAEQKAAYQMSLTSNHTIGLLPYLNLDQDYIRDELQLYASQYGTVLSQTKYRLEGEQPDLEYDRYDPEAPGQNLVITMGTPGLGLDIDKLFNDILDAYSFSRFEVTVKEMAPEALPDALDLEAIYEEFYIEPVNATVDMQKYEPVPGSYGYHFDLEAAQRLLDKANYGETITIPMEVIEPEILEDDVFFRDVLGQCQTPHTTSEDRNTNLKLACAALDGLVLNPGDSFSFNEVLGERTEEKGYKSAPSYANSNVVDAVGGGICQVSSTLYWCTLLADLEIVSRTNHSMPVTYMDLGLDATVSWQQPDFKFKNNTNFPIMLQAKVEGGYVKMEILGTDERDYYVEMEATITNVDHPETIYEEHGPEDGYTDGQVLQNPSVGYTARSYKIKYDKETGQEISRDFEARSQYKRVDKIVVKLVTPTEETTPEETQPAETTPSETTGETTPPTTPQESTETTEPPAETTAATVPSETQAPTEAPAAEAASIEGQPETTPSAETTAPSESLAEIGSRFLDWVRLKAEAMTG